MRIDQDGAGVYFLQLDKTESPEVIKAYQYWTNREEYCQESDPMSSAIANWEITKTPRLMCGLLNPASMSRVIDFYLSGLADNEDCPPDEDQRIFSTGVLLAIKQAIDNYVETQIIPKELSKFSRRLRQFR